ncbi:uncharacterized protein LOC113147392 [Cyclospora cayetanensis]|uniref:Uncharacterized protein LOC113147392 n=1 Tax=Cyclospora cayetanensis TaxID=88456 RepID=A0A6P6S2T9_9EIME|nr:uncharacterized protein LOC113147392 [Cyclospora cayetanensis]
MLEALGFATSPAAAAATASLAADSNALALAVLRQHTRTSVEAANVRAAAAVTLGALASSGASSESVGFAAEAPAGSAAAALDDSCEAPTALAGDAAAALRILQQQSCWQRLQQWRGDRMQLEQWLADSAVALGLLQLLTLAYYLSPKSSRSSNAEPALEAEESAAAAFSRPPPAAALAAKAAPDALHFIVEGTAICLDTASSSPQQRLRLDSGTTFLRLLYSDMQCDLRFCSTSGAVLLRCLWLPPRLQQLLQEAVGAHVGDLLLLLPLLRSLALCMRFAEQAEAAGAAVVPAAEVGAATWRPPLQTAAAPAAAAAVLLPPGNPAKAAAPPSSTQPPGSVLSTEAIDALRRLLHCDAAAAAAACAAAAAAAAAAGDAEVAATELSLTGTAPKAAFRCCCEKRK